MELLWASLFHNELCDERMRSRAGKLPWGFGKRTAEEDKAHRWKRLHALARMRYHQCLIPLCSGAAQTRSNPQQQAIQQNGLEFTEMWGFPTKKGQEHPTRPTTSRPHPTEAQNRNSTDELHHRPHIWGLSSNKNGGGEGGCAPYCSSPGSFGQAVQSSFVVFFSLSVQVQSTSEVKNKWKWKSRKNCFSLASWVSTYS